MSKQRPKVSDSVKPALMSLRQVREYLCLSEHVVRAMIETGVLSVVRFGSLVRVRTSDVERLANEGVPDLKQTRYEKAERNKAAKAAQEHDKQPEQPEPSTDAGTSTDADTGEVPPQTTAQSAQDTAEQSPQSEVPSADTQHKQDQSEVSTQPYAVSDNATCVSPPDSAVSPESTAPPETTQQSAHTPPDSAVSPESTAQAQEPELKDLHVKKGDYTKQEKQLTSNIRQKIDRILRENFGSAGPIERLQAVSCLPLERIPEMSREFFNAFFSALQKRNMTFKVTMFDVVYYKDGRQLEKNDSDTTRLMREIAMEIKDFYGKR